MAGINKKIEKEIVDLKADIKKQMIDLRDEDMTSELLELRHIVFEIHSEVEVNMEITISLDMLHSSGSKGLEAASQKYIKTTLKIFAALGFAKKLSIFKSLFESEKEASKNKFDDINKLNDIRIDFAHPKNKQYKKYTDREVYMNALKIIKNALLLSNEIPPKV